MNVGNSVRKALDDWADDEMDAAMLHACNAVDGTATKAYRQIPGSNARFTRLLRENYNVLGPMAAPGVNLADTRFPVKVERPKAAGGLPDLADVIYGIHRCSHGHGEDLPDGFELLRDVSDDVAGSPKVTRMRIEKGKLRFSDRMIFGLLAVAVLSPVNIDQMIPNDYYLTFSDIVLPIYEWWGRGPDFLVIVAKVQMPFVKLDFGDWMTAAT